MSNNNFTERNREIQAKFDLMTRNQGMRAAFAIKVLAQEYKRAERTIKNIVYSAPADHG